MLVPELGLTQSSMFQGICTNIGDRHGSVRSRLHIDQSLLGVKWRFLRTPDDDLGYYTAWQNARSLERQVERREQEYQEMLLADFAKEFHVADVLAPGGVGVNRHEGGLLRDIEEGLQENAVEGQNERTGRMQSSSVSSLLQEGIFRRESAQSASEHESQQPAIAAREKKQTPSLVAALRKGGVRFPLPNGDMRHSEGSGEWDGVDIATAPYLQEYVASSGKEGMPLTSPCAASGAIQAGIGVDGVASPASRDDIKLDNCRGGRDGKLLPNRPSTPPALLMFGECSRVKIATQVPSELQALLRSKHQIRKVSSGDGGEGSDHTAGTESLKVGLSIEQMSPRRPRGYCPGGRRHSGHGGRKVRGTGEGTPSQKPQGARFRSEASPPPTFRPSSYGKAWYAPPYLWGVEISLETLDLDQEDDDAEGIRQLQAHADMVKATIPSLFSAHSFVTYIRQQGLRLPAHLESTERAMLAEKTLTEKGALAAPKDIAGTHDDAPQEHGDHEESGEENAEDPPLGTNKAGTTRKKQQKEQNRIPQGRREENSRRKTAGVFPRKSTVAGEIGA